MIEPFEHKSEPLLSQERFVGRLMRHLAIASAVAFAALMIGTLGYHFTENFSWLDSALNAAMILTGMGPVNRVVTVCGKLFAIGYALLSGLVLIGVTGLLLVPVFHRILHRFHLDLDDTGSESGS